MASFILLISLITQITNKVTFYVIGSALSADLAVFFGVPLVFVLHISPLFVKMLAIKTSKLFHPVSTSSAFRV
jgi:hypothetical protein